MFYIKSKEFSDQHLDHMFLLPQIMFDQMINESERIFEYLKTRCSGRSDAKTDQHAMHLLEINDKLISNCLEFYNLKFFNFNEFISEDNISDSGLINFIESDVILKIKFYDDLWDQFYCKDKGDSQSIEDYSSYMKVVIEEVCVQLDNLINILEKNY